MREVPEYSRGHIQSVHPCLEAGGYCVQPGVQLPHKTWYIIVWYSQTVTIRFEVINMHEGQDRHRSIYCVGKVHNRAEWFHFLHAQHISEATVHTISKYEDNLQRGTGLFVMQR